MENNRTTKRLIALAIVGLIIAVGYIVGPRAFDMFLAMHGM